MRNIFILNPAAGQGYAIDQIEHIKAAASELNMDVEIYKSSSPIDAEIYSGDVLASREPGEKLRIFACGGDGTLNEVVNACYGHDDVEIGVIPKGTGNDFIRNFGQKERFLDYKAQLMGESIECNIINYVGISNGEYVNRYCCNMFNIGFDCNVAYLASSYKKIPFIKGSQAYLLGVMKSLVEMHGTKLRITFDDKTTIEKDYLLVAIANGCFCGGGIKGVPRANVFDGFFDVSILNPMSRTKFLKMFGKYSKGTHLESKEASKLVTYKKCKSLKIKPCEETVRMCTDGEMTIIGEMEFKIIEKGFKFIIPKDLKK